MLKKSDLELSFLFVIFVYMKLKKRPRIIDGYQMKKQLHGGFKITEYSHIEGNPIKKRTLYKNLTMTDAEDLLYRLESKLK